MDPVDESPSNQNIHAALTLRKSTVEMGWAATPAISNQINEKEIHFALESHDNLVIAYM
jgi:hypothetical protein